MYAWVPLIANACAIIFIMAVADPRLVNPAMFIVSQVVLTGMVAKMPVARMQVAARRAL